MTLNTALLGLLKGVIFNYDEMVQKYDISYITVKRHIKRLRRENAWKSHAIQGKTISESVFFFNAFAYATVMLVYRRLCLPLYYYKKQEHDRE